MADHKVDTAKLRKLAAGQPAGMQFVLNLAADDLDRLRAELANVHKAYGHSQQQFLDATQKCDALAALLREARDDVAEVVERNRQAYGRQLLHKQQPSIDLLARIDALLGGGHD